MQSADGTPRKEHDLVFWEDDAFDDDHIALKWGSVSTLQLPSASTAQRSLRALHKPERKREREGEKERERKRERERETIVEGTRGDSRFDVWTPHRAEPRGKQEPSGEQCSTVLPGSRFRFRSQRMRISRPPVPRPDFMRTRDGRICVLCISVLCAHAYSRLAEPIDRSTSVPPGAAGRCRVVSPTKDRGARLAHPISCHGLGTLLRVPIMLSDDTDNAADRCVPCTR